MVEKNALKRLINFVFSNLSERLDKIYTYHSPTHVCMVYRDSTFLGTKLNISENDMLLLQTAACLHDYGFLTSHIEHEVRSCAEARAILPEYGYTVAEIEIVCGMIMATKIPQSPKTILEQIICDADLFYLGSNYYFEISNEFKKELLSLEMLKSEEQWKNIQIGFLQTHKYHLPFTQEFLNATKAENLSILKSSNTD